MTEREKFEKWISAPPYEKSLIRYQASVVQHRVAGIWPGQYRDYDVQLSWEAWQQAIRKAPSEGG